MAALAVAYKDNTNNLLLSGLKSSAEDIYLNNYEITVTVKDAAGAAVAGETWPLLMTYIEGSNGDYITAISYLVQFVAGDRYTAFVTVDASDSSGERYGHWEFPFIARVRTGS